MSLPSPSTTQTTDGWLFTARSLLMSSLMTDELAIQQAALRASSGNATLTLSAPTAVVIGDPDFADTTAPLAPGIVVWAEDGGETIDPDVAGDVYEIATTMGVMIVMATQDTAAAHEQDMYVSLLRYSHAVAIVLQTYLSSGTYGGAAGVYGCTPITWSLSPPPIRVESGWSMRYVMSKHLVRWQTKQPAPAQP